MIGRVQRAALALLTGIALLCAAWIAGRREGAQKGRAERAESNEKAAQVAKDNRHEMENSDDQRLLDIITGRVRD